MIPSPEDPLSILLDRIHKGEDSDLDADESSPPDLCAHDYDAKKYRNDADSKNKGDGAKKYRNDADSKNKGKDSDPNDDESSPPDLCARNYYSKNH
jgi:hypothetical protein